MKELSQKDGPFSNLPQKHFGVILADPPWRFTTRSEKGRGRSPDGPLNHYQTMSMDDLLDMRVLKLAKEDCVLFLWTADPMLHHALYLAEVWGFKYKTVGFYWVKAHGVVPFYPIGTGYWTRSNPEQCLLFTRGNPKRIDKDVPKLIVSPRREHSRKPDEVHERIESLVGGPYLELFGRQSRPGWTVWGDESTKYDQDRS
jgi:N6-adenosine-specific RNA methylase IME4